MKKFWAVAAVAILAFLGSIAGAPASFASGPATKIEVEDTAGVLYKPQLMSALESIKFYEPTKLVIYTQRGKPGLNLNEDVLAYAKENHPDWLSKDGQKWADGLFIFAVDPEQRKVGSYMGEDRKVSQSKQDAIQKASKDDFRLTQWTDGTIAGVKKGAALINQPWYKSVGFIVTTSIVGGLALLGFGTYYGSRANNRSKSRTSITAGDANFASVSLDLPVTELNAKTIPESSEYGEKVLEKYRNFNSSYKELAGLNQEVHSLSKKDLSTSDAVKKTALYARNALTLDGLDDVIADTNTLLNMLSGWQGAWDRQVQPLRDDLAELPSILSKTEARDSATAASSGAFAAQAEDRLIAWAAQLSSDTLKPEEALDNLRKTREELAEHLKLLSQVFVDHYAKTSVEKTKMRKSFEHARGSSAGYGTPNILGTVYSNQLFFGVTSFNLGYSSGQHSVNSSRSSSSGGSSTGYGSSGGSFSGSGSSSSF